MATFRDFCPMCTGDRRLSAQCLPTDHPHRHRLHTVITSHALIERLTYVPHPLPSLASLPAASPPIPPTRDE